ncbi:MAG TPA: acyl-CoA dehydrogenase [Mycobacteriales bacterium]|jgi:alkylation response protein AidB-like acyl-CoA dehydrogenase|nr:acyl-CoA dehydrogenase [Mycobacteriales bacterium]
MSIAITDDHRSLADSVAQTLRRRDARAAAHALLDAPTEERPAFWSDLVSLGLTGLHVPEEYGGAGGGIEDLVVAVEELGKAVAPGPFVPTVIASSVLLASDNDAAKKAWLPGLADGSRTAAIALDGTVELAQDAVTGTVDLALGAGMADVLMLGVGDDVALVELGGSGVEVSIPPNLDPTRRSGRVTLSGAAATVLTGGRAALRDLARLILSAEAVGVARECTEMGAAYAKVREQFGRPIAMFQAVKHHCANMAVATELASAVTWDAARAASTGGEQRALTAAVAASIAGPAAYLCANLNTQVHGGIAMTWEHQAHLYMRRATVLRRLLDPDAAATDVTDLVRKGVRRERSVDLPPEAESIRTEVREFAAQIKDKDAAGQRDALIESGYVMPHWPKPWGRDAGAVEQLVIEQEFAAAGVKRPAYGITGWVLLTLIQHATPEQVQRLVPPALRQELIWCQLFSEPNAGSDAAGVRTKGTKVEGGWIVNGQKVWTSGAHLAGKGFATVRTDPDVPKHQGITMMVIDMHAKGVEVRPLRQTSGASDFNEVFFNDVFVPDEDVVGPVNGGWTVARATLGNESVSIGGGDGGRSMPADGLIGMYDAHPERLTGGPVRIGRYIANQHAMAALNLRSAHRAVAGGGPGPEGAMTKLVLSEIGHDAAEILADLSGAETAYLDGAGAITGPLVLMHRGMSIAGGTSEIKRNQIAERLLGLPRDPLINN